MFHLTSRAFLRFLCSVFAGGSRGVETLRGFAAVSLERPTCGLSGSEAAESPALLFVGDKQLYLRDARSLEALGEPLALGQLARACVGVGGQRLTLESLAGAPL